MKLVMTLLARDEADVIAENLWFHFQQGVDFVVATDNGSRDGTREVLAEYARQGRLHLIDEPSHVFRQAHWVSRMAQVAHQRFGADWIIHDDADEFWMADQGDLKDALATLPHTVGAARVKRANFLPTRSESEWFIDRLVVRETQPRNFIGKKLLGKVFHRSVAGVRVGNGNHKIRSAHFGDLQSFASVSVRHYPFRSLAQAIRKVRSFGEALAQNPDMGPRTFKVTRHLYAMVLAGEFETFYRGLHIDEGWSGSATDRGLQEDLSVSQFFARRGVRGPPGILAI